ncbi:oligopeptide ABC transporter permease, partial [Lacticaseibacillus paracasei subsp. paracasei Lpp219]
MPKSVGFWASARHKLFKDRLAMFWTVILILIVMVALIGPKNTT